LFKGITKDILVPQFSLECRIFINQLPTAADAFFHKYIDDANYIFTVINNVIDVCIRDLNIDLLIWLVSLNMYSPSWFINFFKNLIRKYQDEQNSEKKEKFLFMLEFGLQSKFPIHRILNDVYNNLGRPDINRILSTYLIHSEDNILNKYK
jgi:hypothetical protein